MNKSKEKKYQYNSIVEVPLVVEEKLGRKPILKNIKDINEEIESVGQIKHCIK